MQIITKYISDNGEEFIDESSCLAYEDSLDLFNGSCKKFFSGNCSLYDVFASVGCAFNFNHSNDITDMLRSIHRDTKLTIRHWQCCDAPKYSVSNLSMNKWMSIEMYFGGSSSIGSGFYQSKVSIYDLLRYYNGTFGITE
jgi:hypothetical protein